MAMTMKTEGLEEVGRILNALGARAEEAATAGLFDGAGVVADAFTAAVNSIKTEEFRYAHPGRTRKPSPEEKTALIGKSGIANFRKNGSEVDTLIGITGSAGYVSIGGKPKAVRLIARAINSGTSFMEKQPVFRRAKNQSTKAASQAIVAKAEEKLNEIIQG